jgi:PilZ domain
MDMSDTPESLPLDGTAAASARNAPRESLFMLGKLTLKEGSAAIDVRVRNLSATGMMVESPIFGKIGQDVSIEIKNIGQVAAKIAWIAEKRMGLALIEQINPHLARQPIGVKANTPSYTQPGITGRSGFK